jgi:predicted lipoprotein with Yx(FWY)xxD motif
VVPVALGVIAAGCGGGSPSSTTGPATGAARTAPRATAATLASGHTKLGSMTRTDGRAQVTYAGHPLYTYAGDSRSGDTAGQGLAQFGAEWYVLAPSGHKIDNG